MDLDNLPHQPVGKSTPVVPAATNSERLADKAAIGMLRKHDLLRAFAELFLLLVGILYATGFLTIFTFLGRFGIRETGSEFLRLKYIYVGILYFLFPLTIMLPLFALWALWKQAKEDKHGKQLLRESGTIRRGAPALAQVQMPFASILLFFNMAFVFYIFICFAPVTFIHNRPWVTAGVSVPTILGALLFRFLETRRLRRRLVNVSLFRKALFRILDRSRTLRRRFRSRELTSRGPIKWWRKIGAGRTFLFLLIVAVVDRPAMHGLWGDLKLMFWGESGTKIATVYGFALTVPAGGFNYFLFVFLTFLVGDRVHKRMIQHASPARTKYLLAAGGLCVSLFVVSVLAFAIRVYPFIPAHKGGGDYRKTGATLKLKEPGKDDLTVPESVVIIEETDSSLFIAIPDEPPIKNSENMRAEADWRVWKNLPTVMEIPRERIAYMHYWPPGKKSPGIIQRSK